MNEMYLQFITYYRYNALAEEVHDASDSSSSSDDDSDGECSIM